MFKLLTFRLLTVVLVMIPVTLVFSSLFTLGAHKGFNLLYDSEKSKHYKESYIYTETLLSVNNNEKETVVNVNNYINNKVKHSMKKTDSFTALNETLNNGAGNSFAIAALKYKTLLSLGVSKEKLQLFYVRAAGFDAPHMVVVYKSALDDTLYVLDHLVEDISTTEERSDLKPIHTLSFDNFNRISNKASNHR